MAGEPISPAPLSRPPLRPRVIGNHILSVNVPLLAKPSAVLSVHSHQHGHPYSRQAEGSGPHAVYRESCAARESEACDGILVYVVSFADLTEVDINRRILDCQSDSLEGFAQWRRRNTTIYDDLDGQAGTGTLCNLIIPWQMLSRSRSKQTMPRMMR